MRRSGALPTAALAAASALAALALAEGVVRVLDLGPRFQVVFRNTIEPSDDPVMEYALRPGAPDGKGRINSAGMRGAEVARAKPAGVYRVVAIGDSVTYGSGGPSERSWPAQLGSLLGAGDARVEVLNLGVPGYNIAQVVERLRVLGLGFAPDAIVYGYVLNDPQAYSLEAEALREMRARAARGGAAEDGGLERVLAHSRLFLWARALMIAPERVRPGDLPRDPAYAAHGSERAAYFRTLHRDGESAQRLERGLGELAALARDAKATALVAIFPLFPDADGEDPLDDVRALVAAAARRAGLAVLDLGPVYAAGRAQLDAPLEVDFLHPNALGARIAAFAVRDWLCRFGAPAAACAPVVESDALDAQLARIATGRD